MRADLERIKEMINILDTPDCEGQYGTPAEENAILRELLTSWQALTQQEYQTDDRLHLNMLTKRMLNNK